MKTEIVPLLIVTKLEQFDYRGRDGAGAGHAGGVVRHVADHQRAAGLDPPARRRGGGAQVSGAKVVGAQTIALRDSPWLRRTLIAVTLGFLALFVVVPIAAVFVEALSKGIGSYAEAVFEPETRAAIKLTLITAAISVPLNLVFGVAAAWLICKYKFPGKSALLTLIDLPFSVSPVISGLIFVLLLGARGVLRPVAGRRTTSRSSSRCRASCWRRPSSRSRSSRAR